MPYSMTLARHHGPVDADCGLVNRPTPRFGQIIDVVAEDGIVRARVTHYGHAMSRPGAFPIVERVMATEVETSG
jgi:hypothetical protein